jgi:uncharacterized membrane protein (DUF485 family)
MKPKTHELIDKILLAIFISCMLISSFNSIGWLNIGENNVNIINVIGIGSIVFTIILR